MKKNKITGLIYLIASLIWLLNIFTTNFSIMKFIAFSLFLIISLFCFTDNKSA